MNRYDTPPLPGDPCDPMEPAGLHPVTLAHDAEVPLPAVQRQERRVFDEGPARPGYLVYSGGHTFGLHDDAEGILDPDALLHCGLAYVATALRRGARLPSRASIVHPYEPSNEHVTDLDDPNSDATRHHEASDEGRGAWGARLAESRRHMAERVRAALTRGQA